LLVQRENKKTHEGENEKLIMEPPDNYEIVTFAEKLKASTKEADVFEAYGKILNCEELFDGELKS